MIRTLLSILALASIAAATATPEYVVITDLNVNADEILEKAASKASTALRGGSRRKPKVKQQLRMNDEIRQQAFNLVTDISDDELELLRAMPGVRTIVPNSPIELAVIDTTPADARFLASVADAGVAPEATRQWNLDRVDQFLGRDGLYTAAEEIGKNVDMYIVDTGVRADHIAFGGRVQPGKNALVGGDEPGNFDCHSHGTHVASTAAGDVYGVARGATIFPVMILECDGRGSLMGMSNGVDWVRSNILKRGNTRKAVVNLSIQAGANEVIDDLIKSLYQAGAVVVVAAANFNADACNYSPAREPLAVTVGATSPDDSRLSSSNYGSCVDLFAPGDMIVGASFTGTTASTTKRGTSMASPLVAGVVATIRERFPNYNNNQVVQHLLSLTTTLGKRVNDADCSGSVEGVKFIQTLTAKNVQDGLGRSSLLASGPILAGDFDYWAPDLSVAPSNGEICVSFKARVTSSRSSISGASVRVAVSTSALTDGVTSFIETPLQCKDITNRWYILDSYASSSQRVSSKLYDFQGNIIGDTSRVPSGELSDKEDREFYVSLKLVDGGLFAELGSGSAASERERIPIVSGVDSNYRVQLSALTKISFSASSNYEVLYTDIKRCGTDGPQVTQPPSTPPTTLGGGDAPPSKIAVTKKDRNFFVQWPLGWSKPQSENNTCFQFKVGLNRAAKVFIALGDQAMGRVKFNKLPTGAHGHVVGLTRNTVQLWRDGQLRNQVYLKPMLNIPKNKTISLTLRAVATPEGDITIYQLKDSTQEWSVLYTFKDVDAGFLGTRLSLSSSVVRTFNDVQVCSDAI